MSEFFINIGRLKTNEKVYINNKPLIETTCYKYFGIMFSAGLPWSTALRTLASRVANSIKFINRECNGLPVQLLFDLFDKLVLPMLLHGSQRDLRMKMKLKNFKESFVNLF